MGSCASIAVVFATLGGSLPTPPFPTDDPAAAVGVDGLVRLAIAEQEEAGLVDPIPGELSGPPPPDDGLGGDEKVLPEDVLPGEAAVNRAARRSLDGQSRGLSRIWPFLGPAFIACIAPNCCCICALPCAICWAAC